MKRTKGFTLVELLVVVAIIALLVSILLPTLGKAKEMAKQALCGANLNGVGKGIVLYQAESDDSTPWIDSSSWSTTTGDHADDTSQPGAVSPTALMFLIVRTGQPVDMFRCPSDSNASKMTSTRFTSGGSNYYYWDFYDKDGTTASDHCKKVSYSYQAPVYNSAGSSYSCGYTSNSLGSLAVMADKTPDFDGEDATTDWTADPMAEASRKSGMSQNHSSGDFINVLFADSHVKGDKRADVGPGNDNIYSASNDSDGGTQGAGSLTLTQHLSVDDAFLIGPID